jgi:hypothetical protein
MRAKTEYVLEEINGKKVPKKVGMAPEVRDGTEYEFDAVLEMTHDHFGRVGKTRCEEIDGWCGEKPGEDIATLLNTWLTTGAAQPTATATAAQAVGAMHDAQKKAAKPAKREACEDDRADFVTFIQAAGSTLKGFDQINEIAVSFGYDSLDAVAPIDFRPIVDAVKKLLPKA